jgi:hypothetical protein
LLVPRLETKRETRQIQESWLSPKLKTGLDRRHPPPPPPTAETQNTDDAPDLYKRHEHVHVTTAPSTAPPPSMINTILNAFFVLARAQLVDQRPQSSAPDSTEETGVQLTTFRTRSAHDPIAEPLYEPPLAHQHLVSETEKGMMYRSTSDIVRGHFRGASLVSFTWLLSVRLILSPRLQDSMRTIDTNSTSTGVINVSSSPVMESSSP